MNPRGFASIGLFNPKNRLNYGGVLRAAGCYGAAMIAMQGHRFKRESSDTLEAWKHIPTIITDDLFSVIPYDTVPVAIEFIQTAKPITKFSHPERAFYIFGPEDGSVSKGIIERCKEVIYIPTSHCMNLAATVNVVLYDRLVKRGST